MSATSAASTARRHFLLHPGPVVDVLEDICNKTFLPLRETARHESGESFGRWSQAEGIGLVHLHGVDLIAVRDLPRCAVRDCCLTSSPARSAVSKSARLRVVGNACGGCVVDKRRRGTMQQASMVIAPSTFIRDVLDESPGGYRHCRHFTRHSGRATSIDSIAATGIRLAIAASCRRRGRRRRAAQGQRDPRIPCRGARGHRHRRRVIGYTDTTLTQRLGRSRSPLHPRPLPRQRARGLARGLWRRARLFPNRVPESFSYTLSEVWSAGLPVIVPDRGALGERVTSHGGGWRLPPGFTGADAATLLIRLFSPQGAAERARVKSNISPLDPARIPTLDAMARDVDALYARFALPSSTIDAEAARDALAPLLAANLDGFVFRKELLNLVGQLEQAIADATEARRWSVQLERDSAAWAAKLEADIATLRRDVQSLRNEIDRLATYKAAFELTPPLAQKYLLRKLSRARR
jgi:hypothetical protein